LPELWAVDLRSSAGRALAVQEVERLHEDLCLQVDRYKGKRRIIVEEDRFRLESGGPLPTSLWHALCGEFVRCLSEDLIMTRECPSCHKALTPQELARQESREMEAQRKKMGLQGILFRYYRCSGCGYADIFVDIRRLDDESEHAFHQRCEELRTSVQELHGDHVAVVVMEK
jgi:hypothetical protein